MKLASRLGLLAAALLWQGCGEATPTPTPVPSPTAVVTPTPVPPPDLPEMEVARVQFDEGGNSAVVLLRETGTNRYLPIGIGGAEAIAIAVKLTDEDLRRPLTHDLLDTMITDLGGDLAHVVITHLLANTFYAKIVLTKDGELLEIDSRPSDAIALALRANIPVFADVRVLERAGVLIGESNEGTINGAAPRQAGR